MVSLFVALMYIPICSRFVHSWKIRHSKFEAHLRFHVSQVGTFDNAFHNVHNVIMSTIHRRNKMTNLNANTYKSFFVTRANRLGNDIIKDISKIRIA